MAARRLRAPASTAAARWVLCCGPDCKSACASPGLTGASCSSVARPPACLPSSVRRSPASSSHWRCPTRTTSPMKRWCPRSLPRWFPMPRWPPFWAASRSSAFIAPSPGGTQTSHGARCWGFWSAWWPRPSSPHFAGRAVGLCNGAGLTGSSSRSAALPPAFVASLSSRSIAAHWCRWAQITKRWASCSTSTTRHLNCWSSACSSSQPHSLRSPLAESAPCSSRCSSPAARWEPPSRNPSRTAPHQSCTRPWAWHPSSLPDTRLRSQPSSL